jgi:uroporphyrinogen-III synthase
MNRDIFVLGDKSVDGAISLPMIQIKYIEIDIDFTLYDALIFTSKNGIRALEHYKYNWHQIPAYSIAKITSQEIMKYGGNLVFTGESSHGNEFAEELITQLQNKKVLYLRANKVLSSLVEILQNHNIDIDEKIVYHTVCKNYDTPKQPSKNSIIIFSSPSTIECFLDNFRWDDSYTAIAIGKTTAKYLPSNIDYIISDKTSINRCVEIAKSLEH